MRISDLDEPDREKQASLIRSPNAGVHQAAHQGVPGVHESIHLQTPSFVGGCRLGCGQGAGEGGVEGRPG